MLDCSLYKGDIKTVCKIGYTGLTEDPTPPVTSTLSSLRFHPSPDSSPSFMYAYTYYTFVSHEPSTFDNKSNINELKEVEACLA